MIFHRKGHEGRKGKSLYWILCSLLFILIEVTQLKMRQKRRTGFSLFNQRGKRAWAAQEQAEACSTFSIDFR